jgi:hypothetical protein
VCYKATKEKRTADYTKTEYYSAVRDGSMAFKKIPVDGSEKMDDKYMDAIEPFDYKQMKDFHTTFLAGYVAEKYDVDAEKSKERAENRIKTSVEREFERSVTGYNSVKMETSSVSVKNGKSSYALFPVWVLNTKYKEENYTFMMNGESGRLVGKLPIDSGKVWKYSFLYAGILGAIISACITFFLWESMPPAAEWGSAFAVGWVVALAMGFAYIHSWKSQMNTALLKTEANAYIVKNSLVFIYIFDKFLYSKTSKIAQNSAKAAIAGAVIKGALEHSAGKGGFGGRGGR